MTVPSMVVDLSNPCGSVTNLSPEIHNLSIPCESTSVIVTPVVQAGFGTTGMFLIAGLGIGFLLLTRKRREEEKSK